MGLLNFNNNNVNLFTNDEKYDTFKSLEELYLQNGDRQRYIVNGVYTYSSKYGESCFLKTNGYNIQLPNHLTTTIEDIRKDRESIEQINNGIAYVEIYSYTLPDKYPGKVFYSINFELAEDK